MFELRLLGPVQAVRAGRDVPLGGPKQRAVLALLLLDAGRVVPAGGLVEDVWRGRAPPGAAKTLRSYVSRLRSALEPEAPVVARGGGYAIGVDLRQVDARRFEQLVAEGQAAAGRGEAVVAGSRFREALALWRGRALADVLDVEPLALESARLEELRLVAVEGRLEADLAAGLHAEVTGELESLVTEHPLRERLWRLLVLALYRGERQADALAAYRRARAMLAGELGLEPGEELRHLERAVLRQDVPPPQVMPVHNLPAQLTSFVGREQELGELGKLLGEARLITLVGTGGAGKTRLATEFAACVVERFAQGAWLADLAGITDPDLVAAQVMEALGVRQGSDLPPIEALRFRLRSAELLLVLDNCEHLLDACADLAAALLASSPGLRVVATSREPLGIAGEVRYQVPPLAVPPDGVAAEVITGAPAVRLFLDRVAAARGTVGREPGPAGAVAGICRKLDGLPLAIELAAARTATLSVEEIETHLADKFPFLTYRRPSGSQRHQALKAAIDWSYELLSAEERQAFSQLSVFAGSFGLDQAAAVCSGGDQAAALDVLDRLASKSMLNVEMVAPGTRYRMLETIRQYAAGHLAEAGGTEATRRRHAYAFLTLAEREHAVAVLSRDHDNFRAGLDWSLRTGDEVGPRLARALGGFWLARGFWREARDWLERALASGPADQQVLADLLRLLGTVLFEAGDLAQAQAVLSEGCAVAQAAELPAAVQARIRLNLTEIRFLEGGGSPSLIQSLTECQAALATLESEGDLEGMAEAWLTIGQLHANLGDPTCDEAFERAIDYARRSAYHRAELKASRWLVFSFTLVPIRVDIAIGRAEQLLEAHSGDAWAEAMIGLPLSTLYAYAGRFTEARATITRAQAAQQSSGARLDRAVSTLFMGEVDMMAGDPAAAEAKARQGCETLRAIDERGYLASALPVLAEAVYAQGRLDEADQLTREAEALATADDLDAHVRWRVTRAKILARRGNFAAARQLASEAEALLAPTPFATRQAEVLVVKAEVAKLAGEPGEADGYLRTALHIHEERRATALADRTRAALVSLSADPR